MKKILFLSLALISFSARSEVFSCAKLTGWATDGISDKTIKQKICNSPANSTSIYENGCAYYVDDKKFTIVCDNKPVEECHTIKNTIDEVVAVCHGTIASGTYLISKDEHKIFYAKVGKIKKGYAQMFEAKCN